MDIIYLSSLFLSILGIFNLIGISSQLFLKQLIVLFLSSVLYFLIKKSNLKGFFKQNFRFFYWLLILFLILNFIVGITVKGAKRWISFYFLNFQPSEFLKPFFALYFADFFTKKRDEINKLRVLFYSFLLVFIPVFLIFKQPDLATALVYLLVFFVLLLFSEIPFSYLLKVFSSFIVLLPLGWYFLKDYQRMRILSFLNPQLDPQGRAYNATQSVISIGSGRLWGKGLGFGSQSRLFFLPENHTDFAFASLVEQQGFVGGVLIFALFSVLIFSLLKKADKLRRNKEYFEFLFTFQAALFIGLQFFINVAMNLKLFPIAGVPLPFISYGGSSLLTFFFFLSLV